jgi:glycine cleavage system H protein
MNVPEKLKYTESHEWIADNQDGTVTIGITSLATEQLGDLVYVELPKPGTKVDKGSTIAVVESTKAASDVYSPVSGEVIAANEDLSATPQKVNESPYEGGWLFKLKLSKPQEMGELLAADAYAKSAGT